MGHSAHALCIVTPVAKLRSGPGANFPLTWLAPKYTPLVEIKKIGNWYQVQDMSGENHWVSGSNISKKMVCVSVKLNTARLRKGPGAKAELADIRQVDKFTPFKRLDAQDDWLQVEASWGESYWLHESTVWRPVHVAKVNF
jgi:SH3-like domain-containing protein